MDFTKLISNFGYVIPIYFEGSIIKDLMKGNNTALILEKKDIKVKVYLSPSQDISTGDFILVATDRTCNLHQVAGFKKNTIQTVNSKGKSNGFVPLKYVYGKVVDIQ